MNKFQKQSVPWAMAAGRALLGPALIAGECCGWRGIALATVVVAALLSDIFDGVLARRWHCDTAGVRLFDSMADTVFYLCVALTLWLAQPHIWQDNALLLGGLLLLEALRFVVDFAKFGKPASYHSYLAKTWGLVLAIAVVSTLVEASASRLLPIALGLGIVTDLEGLAMSLMLPIWRKDVKTISAAWRIRRELLVSPPNPSRRIGRFASAGLGLALVLLLNTPHVWALESNQAVYIGGSTAVAADTAGSLDTTSPTTLFFRYAKPDGTPGQIGIDYAAIKTAYPSKEVTHHLGVAPAITVGLLAARQRRFFLTLTWTDAAGIGQAAKLEVSKRNQDPLLAVIRARMPHPCQNTPAPCRSPAMSPMTLQ